MKKVIKKFLVIPVALALVAPLAACTSNNPTTSASEKASTQSEPAPEKTVASLTKDWYDYTAKDESYSAKFPGQPTEEKRKANSEVGELDLLITMYEDKAKNQFYMTQSIKYPIDPSQYDVEKGLNGGRDGFARGSESTVTSDKKISFNGFPGREVTYQRKKGGAYKTRILIDPKGPTLYQVLIGSENGNLDFPEGQAFLDSLSIPKKQ